MYMNKFNLYNLQTIIYKHIAIDFGKLSKSSLICVASWGGFKNWTPEEGDLYGSLERLIVHKWASPFHGLWLAASLSRGIFV